MPTLSRFLLALIVVALVGYAAVYGLANFVTPSQREITVRIPTDRLQRD